MIYPVEIGFQSLKNWGPCACFQLILSLFPGCARAHSRDHSCTLLHGPFNGETPPNHACGECGHRENRAGGRQIRSNGPRHCHGDKRSFQLLYHIRYAAVRIRKTTREESWSKLWTSWNQKANLFYRWHEYAYGRFIFPNISLKCLLWILYSSHVPSLVNLWFSQWP